MKMRDVTNIIKNNMALKYTENSGFNIDFTFKENIKELTELPCFEDFYDLYEFFINTDAFIFSNT
ncbi:hypothetical protein, partial [Cetobacterium sp.]|uniref:hypothetical protein n=1 Tax=Cetobacterium sp. TaxID=2071632 RepID=UPI003F3C6F60